MNRQMTLYGERNPPEISIDQTDHCEISDDNPYGTTRIPQIIRNNPKTITQFLTQLT